MYFETGSLRISLPSSMSIRIATAVTGFVMDARRNSVSVRIGAFDSKSVVPKAAKCTTLLRRATSVTAPVRSFAAMWLLMIGSTLRRRSDDNPTSSGFARVIGPVAAYSPANASTESVRAANEARMRASVIKKIVRRIVSRVRLRRHDRAVRCRPQAV
jgi:hypothetical protein